MVSLVMIPQTAITAETATNKVLVTVSIGKNRTGDTNEAIMRRRDFEKR